MAMEYRDSIRLDIACKDPCVIVNAKQLDNKARIITAEFYDSRSGERFVIPETATAEFRIRRRDGVMISAKASKGNYTVSIRLSSEMLAVHGKAAADFRLTDSSGEILSAQAFFINILPTAKGEKSGGLSPETALNICKISAADFKSLTARSDNTVYYVTDKDKVEQYIGDTKLSSGALPQTAAVSAHGITGGIGAAAKNDEYVTE